MAEGFKFLSPSVKFREVDLTTVSRTFGTTFAGLVGETQKGAAFEPIAVSSISDFRAKFGTTSTERFGNELKYLLPYYAEAYLAQSSQLTVVRTLGLSGYDAGTGWAITVDAAPDEDTEIPVDTQTFSGVTLSTGQTGSFFVVDSTITINVPTGTQENVPITFNSDSIFDDANDVWNRYEVVYTLTDATNGVINYEFTKFQASPIGAYHKMVVAIIRSRADYANANSNVLNFRADGVNISTDELNGLYNEFTLEASGNSNEVYTVSLNPNAGSFVTRVLGDKPKGKNNLLYVEAVYPDLIKKLFDEQLAFRVSRELVDLETEVFTNYEVPFQTPTTPFVVSELRGAEVQRLFKFVSISDGASANREIKISFERIDPINLTFDVIIRDFNDTDDNPVVLETFVNCTMNESLNNFVGRRIGTSDLKYDRNSNYVTITLAESFPQDAIPSGFEGYITRAFDSGATNQPIAAKAPAMFYKTAYIPTDRVRRTYLGISEKAFDSISSRGRGINQNMFNYIGDTSSSVNITDGFHLDSLVGTALNGYQVGVSPFNAQAVLDPTNVYASLQTRKFTLVPAGGFDGWDEHRDSRTKRDIFRKENPITGFQTSDYEAYLRAIQIFSNAEDVFVNVLATPGINVSDNLGLVNEVIEIVTEDRGGDCLYLADLPDLHSLDATTTPEDIVSLLEDTGIDSSYAAVYYPYIRVRDNVNNLDVFVPPTGEVLRQIAFTDNVNNPWYAPAGVNRGTTRATGVRVKFNERQRDVLQQGRINPLPQFTDVGVTIFGQKTLQIAESALNRINVRRLLIQAKRLVAQVAVRLLFEPNDEIVRDEFLNKINPIFSRIKADRGLLRFEVTVDSINTSPESIDRGEMFGTISLQPTRALEFIGVEFRITPAGASFSEI